MGKRKEYDFSLCWCAVNPFTYIYKHACMYLCICGGRHAFLCRQVSLVGTCNPISTLHTIFFFPVNIYTHTHTHTYICMYVNIKSPLLQLANLALS